ncbi:hypothetical protein ID866_7556 [Astraeus odoratus]|nr:hypothetical protein ID866_7556 [Astraeus odoratus]
MTDNSVAVALTPFSGGGERTGSRHTDILTSRTPIPTTHPNARHRHAAPSAPWPWMDFDMDDSAVEPLFPPGGLLSPEDGWKKYPQNLFGNWTPDQVRRSKMLTNCSDSRFCTIYRVDVRNNGTFDKAADEWTRTVTADTTSVNAFWRELQEPPPEDLRVRALFVDNLSLHVLQMLGTAYNIEPFFFSSSANWIPSRYQEDPQHDKGDHITVTLPFICTMKNPAARPESVSSAGSGRSQSKSMPYKIEKVQVIDTQVPLDLSSTGSLVLQDLLAIHMVRSRGTSTIISYHPISSAHRTSAKRLRSLVQRTGDSVYWSKIFARSKDPTFLFLAILWYALYEWDQAFEVLYKHISHLEADVLRTNDINLTRELHKVEAHLLYYKQLLQDFKKSVHFVRDTPNPAMEGMEGMDDSEELMKAEAGNLDSEIERLEGQRQMQSDRLQNVMRLAFATVNIEDSRAMQRLTEASMRDSAAMKQISYLTMVFLPASLMASVFGMNVMEINPGTKENLAHFAVATVALTIITAWLVIALQLHSSFWPPGSGLLRRLAWPIFYGAERIRQAYETRRNSWRERSAW